jgi:hypothetical protein
MVKKADSSGAFLFSIDGCTSWIEVPLDAISSAQLIGVMPCKDHSHSVVRIEFGGDAGAGWELSLLRSMQGALRIAANYRQGYGLPDELEEEERLGATATCTRCIRQCGRDHVGDPIGYMVCAFNCPC